MYHLVGLGGGGNESGQQKVSIQQGLGGELSCALTAGGLEASLTCIPSMPVAPPPPLQL